MHAVWYAKAARCAFVYGIQFSFRSTAHPYPYKVKGDILNLIVESERCACANTNFNGGSLGSYFDEEHSYL